MQIAKRPWAVTRLLARHSMEQSTSATFRHSPPQSATSAHPPSPDLLAQRSAPAAWPPPLPEAPPTQALCLRNSGPAWSALHCRRGCWSPAAAAAAEAAPGQAHESLLSLTALQMKLRQQSIQSLGPRAATQGVAKAIHLSKGLPQARQHSVGQASGGTAAGGSGVGGSRRGAAAGLEGGGPEGACGAAAIGR